MVRGCMATCEFHSHCSDSACADARSLSCDQKNQHVPFFGELPTNCLTQVVVSAEASPPSAAWAFCCFSEPQGGSGLLIYTLNAGVEASSNCRLQLAVEQKLLIFSSLARFRLIDNPQDLRHEGLTPHRSPFSEFNKNQWFRLFVSVVDLEE